jgi:hypothetical protein
VRLRRLSAGEAALARAVFGEAFDPGGVRMLIGIPNAGWAMVLFGLMLFPREIDDFAAEPLRLQAWFVHELTHVWQFRTRPMRTLASWAVVALSGGYLTRRAYRYALPLDWTRLNLEQQAKALEHAFLLRHGVRTGDMPPGAVLADYAAVTGNP